jgi:DNA helicase-2/ATP-dependent DNA helicase PcrA
MTVIEAVEVKKPFVPSPKQEAIYKWARTGQGSAIVIAVAGSGKSTSMVHLLPHLDPRDSVLMLAFNATVAKELKAKIETLGNDLNRSFSNVRACTFHSLGYSAVCKRLNKRMSDMQPDDRKVRKLAKVAWDEDTFKLYATFCTSLVGMAKGEGVRVLKEDTEQTWYDLVAHHDLTLDSEEASIDRAIELSRELLVASNKAAIQGSIDYNDMIYLPVLWKLTLWQNRWVIVDEAQDTNPVRRELARKALRPAGRFGGRLIAVGDPMQSIYGFTGASTDAMDLIRDQFHCIELPLTVSYRCPKAVGAVAQQWVPYFEVADTAPDGEVCYDVTVDELDLTCKDAVLCRNTGPLVSLAYKLLSQGVACHVLGSEIGKGLVDLIDKMNARTVDGLSKKLGDYRDREVAKAREAEDDNKANAIEDRVACIMTFIDNMTEGKRTIAELKLRIEALFSDQAGVLTLSTVHKAKGREWPTVAILEPQLMPGRARQPWQQDQEVNLMYVAATRAQERLVYMAAEQV